MKKAKKNILTTASGAPVDLHYVCVNGGAKVYHLAGG